MKKVYPPYELSLIASRCHVAGLPTDIGIKGRLASTPWIFSFTSFSAPRLALSTIILSQLLVAAVTSFELVMVSVFSFSKCVGARRPLCKFRYVTGCTPLKFVQVGALAEAEEEAAPKQQHLHCTKPVHFCGFPDII